MPAYIPIVFGTSQTILAAAGSLGAAVSQVFVAQNDYPVTLVATKVGVFTTLTFNIVTILPTGDQVVVGTWDAVASGSMTFSLSRGVPYQIVCTAFAGGTTVAVSSVLLTTQTANTAPQPVIQQTLTKGSQSANGVSTQDLKDSGRVIKVFSASFTGATTEAVVTLTPISDGTAGGTATTFTVTAGKRLRLQAMAVTTKNAGAAVQGIVCNLRMTATGAATASSPLIATVGAGTLSATANIVGEGFIDFPDGLELSGTMQFAISQVGTATAGNVVTLIGYEY